MTYKLLQDVHQTESMARLAMPYIPKKSKYRTLVYKLLADPDKMTVLDYLRLKQRLIRFHNQS